EAGVHAGRGRLQEPQAGREGAVGRPEGAVRGSVEGEAGRPATGDGDDRRGAGAADDALAQARQLAVPRGRGGGGGSLRDRRPRRRGEADGERDERTADGAGEVDL